MGEVDKLTLTQAQDERVVEQLENTHGYKPEASYTEIITTSGTTNSVTSYMHTISPQLPTYGVRFEDTDEKLSRFGLKRDPVEHDGRGFWLSVVKQLQKQKPEYVISSDYLRSIVAQRLMQRKTAAVTALKEAYPQYTEDDFHVQHQKLAAQSPPYEYDYELFELVHFEVANFLKVSLKIISNVLGMKPVIITPEALPCKEENWCLVLSYSNYTEYDATDMIGIQDLRVCKDPTTPCPKPSLSGIFLAGPFRQVSYLQQRSCTHPTQPTPTKPKSMPIPIPVQNQQRQPHRTTMSDIQITVHSLSTSQPEPTPPPSLDTQSDPGPRGVNMSGSPHNTQERQTLLDELAAKYSIKSNTVPFAKLQLKRRLSDGLSIPQVFEATYDSTSVAVKYYELNRKTTAQTVRKGMLGEAAIMSCFPSNPRIVQLIGFIDELDQKNQNYLVGIVCAPVMKSLGDYLADIKDQETTISQDNILVICNGILEGLKALHDYDPMIVHSDIKPDNILVTIDASYNVQEVRLCDFGMSKPIRASRSYTQRTGFTPHYDAPDGDFLFKESDIYSFGIVLWVLMTLQEPNQNIPRAEMLTTAIEPFHAMLTDIIRQCIQPYRINRFRSCDQIIAKLKTICMK